MPKAFEEMTQEELLRQVRWMKEDQDLLSREYYAIRDRFAELESEHRAMENAYQLKEEEAEGLKTECEKLREMILRERREHAQGDTLRHLRWKKVEAKGETYCVITGCSPEAVSVTVPESIESLRVIGVDEGAFCDCPELRHVDLPYGMRAIAENSFQNCASLETAAIPKSVIFIGKTAFSGCRSELEFTGDRGAYIEWFAQYHGFRFKEAKPFD